jgi:4-hydroxy-tetrahydrodipicolinate synthase
MFEITDNVTMVKASIGVLSRMTRIEAPHAGRLPFCNGRQSPVLGALQASPAGWCPAGPCPRPQPASTRTVPYAQANCQERKLFTMNFSRWWSSPSGAASPPRCRLLGVGVGDPSRPLSPVDDEGRATLKELLSDAWPRHRA